MARNHFTVDVTRYHDPSWASLTLEEQATVHLVASIPHGIYSPIPVAKLLERRAELRWIYGAIKGDWLDYPHGGIVLSPYALRYIRPVTRSAGRQYIPIEVRREVFERDYYACVFCGSDVDLHLDHVYPWSLGGPDTVENLQVLCRPCNLAKSNRVTEPEWVG